MRALLILCLSLFATFSFAQSQENTQLNTLEIQGNKENRSFQESTESISIVPTKELDSPVQSDSVQALNAVPNITVNKNDNTFSIRGINNTGVTGYAKDNVASILVDSVFQTDLAIKAGSFDLWDIHHVEVYRGPQSTSQGVNSLAGSLLLFHNQATESSEGALKLGYGSYNKQEYGLMTNTSWLEGRLLSRFTFNREQTDGFIKNLATDNSKWGAKEKNNFGLDLVYKLNSTDYVRFNSKFVNSDNGGSYVQSANPFDYTVDEDVDLRSRTKNNQHSLRYFKQWDSNWSNEVIAAYSASRNDESSDADGTSAPTAGIREERHIDSFVSVENLIKYESERIKNVIGLHAHRFQLMDDDIFTMLLPLPSPLPPQVTTVSTRQKTDKDRSVFALFDSLHFKIDEHRGLNLGLRYEYVKNSYDAAVQAKRLEDFGAAGNAMIDGYLAQRTGNYSSDNYSSVILPKAAYTYTVDVHTYGVSYSQGYRTGGVSINRSKAKTDDYDPELTQNYELSYKYAEDRLRFSSNAFYTDWKDQQVLVQLSNDTFDSQVKNAASSELYGMEAEAQWDLSTTQNLGLSAGYVMTRFNDFQSRGKDFSGKEFPFAPNWTGKVFYSQAINNALSASAILRYLGSSYTNADNDRHAPEQFYLDLSAQYLWANYNLVADFYSKNVLDSQYLLVDGRPLTSTTPYQSNYHQVNTPREFGLRLTYMW